MERGIETGGREGTVHAVKLFAENVKGGSFVSWF